MMIDHCELIKASIESLISRSQISGEPLDRQQKQPSRRVISRSYDEAFYWLSFIAQTRLTFGQKNVNSIIIVKHLHLTFIIAATAGARLGALAIESFQ